MLKLKESDRFKKEYNNYKRQIESISDLVVRKKGLSLLSRLQTYCNLIDEGHNSRNNGNINPKGLRDNVLELIEIRRSLDQLVKDLKS